jgi:predicted membrane protein
MSNHNQRFPKDDFDKPYPTHKGNRPLLGLILVLIGVILIADNSGMIPYSVSRIVISWQMLLIVIGLFNLAKRAFTPGFILIAIGGFFLLPRISGVPDNIVYNFWPAVLVIIGLAFLLDRSRHGGGVRKGVNPTDYFDEVAILGGRETSLVTDNFRGGKVTTIFGGCTFNLLKANPADDCTIDMFTMFGGSKFIVPSDWNVKVEVVSILGGFSDKRSISMSEVDTNKVVVIKGFAIFGGGEVANLP